MDYHIASDRKHVSGGQILVLFETRPYHGGEATFGQKGKTKQAPAKERQETTKVACRRDLIAGRLAHENHDQIQWITSGDGKR